MRRIRLILAKVYFSKAKVRIFLNYNSTKKLFKVDSLVGQYLIQIKGIKPMRD